MNIRKNAYRLMFAAALAGIGSTGLGQTRVDQGNALDANNRIGSGGRNDGTSVRPGPLGNSIVTGNVTSGFEFRGNVPYSESRAFRGNLAGSGVDRFIRGSTGLGYGGKLDNNSTGSREFYGTSRGTAAPAGFEQQGSSGGYEAALPSTRLGSDLRLGVIGNEPTYILPRPGQLLLPGPVDPSNNNVMITASPLYGVRALNSGQAGDVQFLSRYTDAFGTGRREADDSTVNRLRDELNAADSTAEPLSSATPDARIGGSEPLASDVSTGQSTRGKLNVPPAVRQSAQYAALVRQLEQYNKQRGGKISDAEAARQLQMQKQLADQIQQGNAQAPAERPVKPPVTGGGEPGAPTNAPQPKIGEAPQAGVLAGPTRAPNAPKVAPTVVKSFATGIQAKGLADLLIEAEALMKQGKYSTALDKYDLAEQVAANNPLVLLGRATAELGASYYSRAELHIRQAFTNSPALMMAQYDLKALLGEERLTFLVNDLKEIATNEPKSPRPVFLLAYIAYNEGSERMAGAYLDLAEKRSEGDRGFIDSVRQHWQIPTGEATPESPLNK